MFLLEIYKYSRIAKVLKSLAAKIFKKKNKFFKASIFSPVLVKKPGLPMKSPQT